MAGAERAAPAEVSAGAGRPGAGRVCGGLASLASRDTTVAFRTATLSSSPRMVIWAPRSSLKRWATDEVRAVLEEEVSAERQRTKARMA